MCDDYLKFWSRVQHHFFINRVWYGETRYLIKLFCTKSCAIQEEYADLLVSHDHSVSWKFD